MEDTIEQQTRQLNVPIPSGLMRRLKVAAAQQEIPLRVLVRQVLEQATKEMPAPSQFYAAN